MELHVGLKGSFDNDGAHGYEEDQQNIRGEGEGGGRGVWTMFNNCNMRSLLHQNIFTFPSYFLHRNINKSLILRMIGSSDHRLDVTEAKSSYCTGNTYTIKI